MNDRDREMLDFEESWWQFRGGKEAQIAARFAMSPTRYYQRLNAVLDDPEALQSHPLLVNRLRRLRSRRMKERNQRNGFR